MTPIRSALKTGSPRSKGYRSNRQRQWPPCLLPLMDLGRLVYTASGWRAPNDTSANAGTTFVVVNCCPDEGLVVKLPGARRRHGEKLAKPGTNGSGSVYNGAVRQAKRKSPGMKQPAKPLILLWVISALGMKPTSAVGGDCLYDCEGSTCADFSNKTDFCQELRAKCQARCSGRRWWGAIAYSARDKQSGSSYGLNDLRDAQKTALDRCSKSGSACKLWIWYENECGAIAADGNIVTWGTAYLRENAEQKAMLECKKAGGENCAIQIWACSKM
jgi:hypothetical protein